jgi:hypothetical protein
MGKGNFKMGLYYTILVYKQEREIQQDFQEIELTQWSPKLT